MLIVTAEPGEQNLAATRKSANNYSGEAVVDPEHKLANYLREKGLLDVAVTEKGGYVKGVAQPAILVVKRDGEVLEQWAIKPSTVCDVKASLSSSPPLSFEPGETFGCLILLLSLSLFLLFTGRRDGD